MHDIETQDASPEFLRCLQDAGRHLDRQVQGGIQSWLRAHPYPPFLEHLSFRLGNQLFFVRIVDVDEQLEVPGSLRGLFMVADRCHGHPCLMPMKRKKIGGEWLTSYPGWGLINAKTMTPINPVELITDEPIEMTDWELQDLAVQVVRSQLEKDGYQLMSWQPNSEVNPSIWFVGDSKGPEWVVVRADRYPKKEAVRPANWNDIADHCGRLSEIGHFASVVVANADDPFDPLAEENGNFIPLYRGHGMTIKYEGLKT